MRAIMVGVDGSQHSEVALRYAMEIADLAGAEVIGLASVAGDFDGEAPLDEHAVEELEALAALPEAVVGWFRDALDDCAETCARADVEFTAHMLAGRPAQVIPEEAQACDLVVLGAKSRHDSEMVLVGPTAVQVTRSCIKPVLITRGEHRPIRRVMVGYDAGPASGHAVEWVADLARAGGWEVAVVSGAMPESSLAEGVEYAATLVETRGVTPETMLVEGDAPAIIFEQARAWQPDLIAVGGPHRGALSGFFLGEAWPEIVEQADVPVLRWR